jgi:hypothetical protein
VAAAMAVITAGIAAAVGVEGIADNTPHNIA